MYTLINDHAQWLSERFDGRSVARYRNTLTADRNKQDFKSFYGLNGAHLSADFLERYFEVLDSKKIGNVELGKDSASAAEDAGRIAAYLATIPSNGNGYKIQFSFSTKLLHTINPDCPIYDSHIADFYFFPPVWNLRDNGAKLQAYKNQYIFLIQEYKRIKENNLLDEAISVFQQNIEGFSEISYIKQIDFILWRFTAELRNGALLENTVQYA